LHNERNGRRACGPTQSGLTLPSGIWRYGRWIQILEKIG
jgi:hypothetical protein